MAAKFYPVGIQTFSEIITKNYLYVDKTGYIHQMTHSGKKYLLLRRPRRFGKSLLVSTLQSYFEGKKELFKGLEMERLEQDWVEYPVLHFDLSGGKHMQEDALVRYLLFILKQHEEKWGITTDAPLLDVVHEENQLVALRQILRIFFSPLKDSDSMLHFVFLTGITKFSQLSIFSELNNITNISMLPEYAGVSDFDAPTETMTTLTPLLYQSGYITIKDYEEAYDSYTLGIPNREVRLGLTKALIPYYVTPNTQNANNTTRNMARAFDKEDLGLALQYLQTFLGTVPYCAHTDYEGHYQQMFYVIFSLLTAWMVDVEVHTPNGRVDIVVMTKSRLYLIELKLNQNAQVAMQQIYLKNYRQRFALSGLPITKVGVNFDSATHNITDWVVE